MSLQTAIERSASPPAVSVAVERLLEAFPGLDTRLEDDNLLREAVVAVTAASRSLTGVLLADPLAVDVLADLERRPVLDEVGRQVEGEGVARWKRLGVAPDRGPGPRRPGRPAGGRPRPRHHGQRGAGGRLPAGRGTSRAGGDRHGQAGRRRAQLLQRRRHHLRGRARGPRPRRPQDPRDRPELLPRRRRPAPRGTGRPAGAVARVLRGLLGPLGPDVGVPGSDQGPSGGRRPGGWEPCSSSGPRRGCGTGPSPSTTCGRCGP